MTFFKVIINFPKIFVFYAFELQKVIYILHNTIYSIKNKILHENTYVVYLFQEIHEEL